MLSTFPRRVLPFLLLFALLTFPTTLALAQPYNIQSILDPTTLNITVDQDWHTVPGPVPTLQKNLTLTACEWWPGETVRLPLILVVPADKQGPFNFIVANASLTAKRINISPGNQTLLKRGIAFAHIGIGPLEAMQPAPQLNEQMNARFLKTANPRFTSRWLWGISYMRAITGALTEPNYFKADKIALTGGSKRGVATTAAATWDPRVTAILPIVPPLYDYFPNEKQKAAIAKSDITFHKRAKAGQLALIPETYQNVLDLTLRRKTHNLDDENFAAQGWSPKQTFNAKTATGKLYKAHHNYPLWRKRNIDILSINGSNDNVSPGLTQLYELHPSFPALILPGGHHGSATLGSTRRVTVDPLTTETTAAFFSNHFFNDRPMMQTPIITTQADPYAINVTVTFPQGPLPTTSTLYYSPNRTPDLSQLRQHDEWLQTALEPINKSNPHTLRGTIPVFPNQKTIDIITQHSNTINKMPAHITGPYTHVIIPK